MEDFGAQEKSTDNTNLCKWSLENSAKFMQLTAMYIKFYYFRSWAYLW